MGEDRSAQPVARFCGGDAVVRLGEDRFAILLAVPDEVAASSLRERIRRELGDVRVPRRVRSIEPRIAIAIGEAADIDARFDGLEEELERLGQSTRAAGLG